MLPSLTLSHFGCNSCVASARTALFSPQADYRLGLELSSNWALAVTRTARRKVVLLSQRADTFLTFSIHNSFIYLLRLFFITDRSPLRLALLPTSARCSHTNS